MQTTINYKGKPLTRFVKLFTNHKGFITGSVGSCNVYWDTEKYRKPRVTFSNSTNYSDAYKKEFLRIVIRFIDEYYTVLLEQSGDREVAIVTSFDQPSELSKSADSLIVESPTPTFMGTLTI